MSVSQLLLAAFLFAAGAFLLTGSVGLMILWRLRRRNRLHPRWPTTAPLVWLVHPGAAARLHRRLRAAVATAGYRAPRRRRHTLPQSSVDELVLSLVHEAAAIDEQVVVAGRAPRAVRRQLVAVTAPHVAQIERLAARLAVLVSVDARPGAIPAADSLRTLEDRIDVLEVSRQEIADLEAALHMVDVRDAHPAGADREHER